MGGVGVGGLTALSNRALTCLRATCLLLCRRLRRLLHGALHLSSGNAAQLAVPQTGQRVPGQRVRERRGPAHEDDQRSETLRGLKVTVAAAEPDPRSLFSSLQLCRPCSPHTTSRRWTRTSLRGSSHPPCLSDLAPTDLLGVSIAGARLPRLSHCQMSGLFRSQPHSSVSVLVVCHLCRTQ